MKKRNKGLLFCLSMVIIIGFSVLQTKLNREVNFSIEDEILQIYFFDVGQADSQLIVNKGQTMLIDAGTNKEGEALVEKIKSLGIHKIDYLVGTHPHEDHIGGMDDIIKNFEIGQILMPKIQTNTKTFEDVLDAIEEKNLSITTPEEGKSWMIGQANCTILACDVELAEKKNNLNLSSIVIRITYGKQSYLFMGDSEKENEQIRTWEQTNVIKIGHHGSNTSSSKKFLEQIKPQIAIIEVGKNNTYGHPKEEIIKRLKNIGCKIYRTDEEGNLLLTSDGIQNKIEKVSF